jgi:hypothetical protein
MPLREKSRTEPPYFGDDPRLRAAAGGNWTPDGILQWDGEAISPCLGAHEAHPKTTLYGVVFQKLNGPLLTSAPGGAGGTLPARQLPHCERVIHPCVGHFAQAVTELDRHAGQSSGARRRGRLSRTCFFAFFAAAISSILLTASSRSLPKRLK